MADPDLQIRVGGVGGGGGGWGYWAGQSDPEIRGGGLKIFFRLFGP